MKLAILSDIHGNEQALKAVLEDVKDRGTTDILVLGDIAYRGPKPKECIDLIRPLRAKVIKGNADAWAVRGVREGEVPDNVLEMMQSEQTFTRSHITEEDADFLDKLPHTTEIPLTNKRQLFAFHADPESLFKVVPDDASNETLSEWFAHNPRAEFFTYGHIHLSHFRHIDGKKVFNPGSIGLPFDGDPRASYVLLQKTAGEIQIEFRRVSYDVEKALADLTETGYPQAAVPLLTHIYKFGEKPS
ncbi:metallophosphoesterase family protein [Alkalicoccus halolimnae]|uniref:Metallophosphoesterase family protein n=1 Tax=Alkalicoccus halolimnae TaxID=1667239 RepID=A0A5C7F912_9BACI|nr:metallophosphoesterase family protein [Alkalicoccus halolimnae]TXF87152.1 YfcE family phosphodiesterase [Alkalicoccus halolimnae]